jgi:uncharacterized protein (DUF779 family)
MPELPKQVLATDLAIHLTRVLREKHGPLMFHQSGGLLRWQLPDVLSAR